MFYCLKGHNTGLKICIFSFSSFVFYLKQLNIYFLGCFLECLNDGKPRNLKGVAFYIPTLAYKMIPLEELLRKWWSWWCTKWLFQSSYHKTQTFSGITENNTPKQSATQKLTQTNNTCLQWTMHTFCNCGIWYISHSIAPWFV